MLPVSKLIKVRLVIAEEVIDEDGVNPVKHLATSKIDAPSAHIIRSYSQRWHIETFFEGSKRDLGLRDCEMPDSDGVSHHWHLQMSPIVSFVLVPNRAFRSDEAFEISRSDWSSNTVSKRWFPTCSRGCAISQTVTSTDWWKKSTTFSSILKSLMNVQIWVLYKDECLARSCTSGYLHRFY